MGQLKSIRGKEDKVGSTFFGYGSSLVITIMACCAISLCNIPYMYKFSRYVNSEDVTNSAFLLLYYHQAFENSQMS